MISVIVPVYNIERFLPSTLDSLINQIDNVDFEILLIDDGSTDKSGDISDEYASEYDNISVIHKSNGGLSSARNAGIEAARGEYLMFVDGDDCLDSVTLAALTKAILLHPHCDVIQFRYEEVSPSMPLGHCTKEELENYYESTDEYDYFLQLYQFGGVAASACTKLIKRSAIGDLRFKEGIIHEDEEFITRLLPMCSCIGYCSNQFYKYVMRSGSIIHSNFSSMRLDIIPILKERIAYLESKKYDDLAEKFKVKLYGVMRILWDEAYMVHNFDSTQVIERELIVLSSVKSHKGTDWLILKSGELRPWILRGMYHFRSMLMPIVRKFRNAIIKYNKQKVCKARRKQLKFTDFTIISNNCWGGLVYQYFGLPYNTPIAGCGFMDDDYIKFLENFNYYITQPLVFISFETSKRQKYYLENNIKRPPCPIALLDDVEICFTHYHTEEEARSKWERRCERINKDRILIKMSQRYKSGEEVLERFEKLPFKNKICFIESVREGKEFIYIPELKRLNVLGGDEMPYVMDKVNLVELINNMR